MYLNHYKLKLMPFEIGPDPKFLWLGSKHKEVFAALRYGIMESKGFIVIIGDPGTGKSTLLNATAANFGSNIRFAKITDPALSEMDFYNFAANAFEMGKTFKSKAEFLIEMGEFVKEAGAQSRKVILVIDEAQRLTANMLEQIRVFSNIETPGEKVVSCIFAGQTEFLDMVKQNQALVQRVFFSHIMQPLTQSETAEYIAHRLKIAGTEESIFTSTAVQEIFKITDGIPRLINILCDQSLLTGYAMNIKRIGPEVVRESTENTLIPLKTQEEPAVKAQTPDFSRPSVSTEPATANTREAAQYAPAKAEARARKTAYWVPILLLGMLGLAAYLYLNDGIRPVATARQTDSGQPQNNVQPAVQTPDAGEVERLQMLGLRKGKDDAGIRIRELQTRFKPLEKDKQEMIITSDAQKKIEPPGSAQDQTAQLEAAASEREKKLTQLEQKLGEMEKNLAKEEAAKDEMGAELSSRHTAIADLEKQHETFRSVQLKLETDIRNTQQENARLQSRLQEVEVDKKSLPTEPAPQATTSSQAPPVAKYAAGPAPDPADVIDFIIKKKSQ